MRVEQILGYLGYLPVVFTPRGHVLSDGGAVQAGVFTWRWSEPVALRTLWRAGSPNVIEDGGLITFEQASGLASSDTVTPVVVHALLIAAKSGRRDPRSYNNVYVTTALPERAYLYVGGRLKWSSPVNTGVSSAPTELGTWPVYLRYVVTTMSGTYPGGGGYSDPGIPWVSYFNGGDALHGFIRASYGWPQSLGCVEMPFANAKVLWPYTPLGTLVTVSAVRP
jgi:hypothetical protein